ncbi:general substrate transporter [Linderina pennispora]|uniref:General substrate transporter n=1 Tax=Linderina pennispora TaxID=61395 RepID=A0A1Y1WGR7_9FUNG|nr:general substrate transporter [Linderina pennispora]ORX72324.1 general substrate transporter [Linderina pennispora]
MSNFSKLARQRTTYIALIIASYGLLYGLDTATTAVAIPALKGDFRLDSLQIEFICASTMLGAICGLIFMITLGNKWGRRLALLVDSSVYIVGFLLTAMSSSFYMCIVGRAIIGVAHGISTMIAPVFIGEISPKAHRGLFITFNMVGINVGMLGGFILCWIATLATLNNSWRWVFALCAVSSLILLVLMVLFVPNSPRDLIFRNRVDEASKVISMLNGPATWDAAEVRREIDAIADVIQSEKCASFRQLFSRANARPLAIACILQAAKQSSGFSSLQYFSAYLFQVIGVSGSSRFTQAPTVILSCVQVASVLTSLGVVDRIGRKRLLLISFVAMAVGLVVLGGAFVTITGFEQINKADCTLYTRCGACLLDTSCGWAAAEGICLARSAGSTTAVVFSESCQMHFAREHIGSWLAVISIIFSLGTFTLGLGSIPWVIQSEIFCQAMRSRASGVAAIFNWLFSYTWTVSFLQLAFNITLPGVFWFYAALMCSTIGSIFWMIPETSGKSLEEITVELRSASLLHREKHTPQGPTTALEYT